MSAGDFPRFRPRGTETGSLETNSSARKAQCRMNFRTFLGICGWRLLQLQAEHPEYVPVSGFLTVRLFAGPLQNRPSLLCLREQASLTRSLTPLSANTRRVRSADDLSASTGRRF